MITLQTAQQMLSDWLKAEAAVMTGQEYRVGNQMLRRVNLSDIRAAITYWSDKVDELSGKPRISMLQAIPRDV